jgi:23S rRNA (pseudouridine1915-N3)-methyltransferase
MIEDKDLVSARKVIFLVGGFMGLAPEVLEKADLKISLSRMTFSHELARVVLLEQVYRAMNIVRGYSYPE